MNIRSHRSMARTSDESIVDRIHNRNRPSMNSVTVELEEEQDDLSPVPDEHTEQLSTQKRMKTGSLVCVVCGSPALGYNFDAITCESCKAFFRRNALKDPAAMHCRRIGDCEVTNETRRRCSACRLAKCLKSGMKRERLQRAEEKAAKRRLLEENRMLTFKNHLLTGDENQILSRSNLPSSIDHQLRHSQKTLLTKEDLDRIEHVRNTYERRIELAAHDGLPWNPSVNATNLLQYVNSRSVPAIRLIAFFRRIPEFSQLNVDDKVVLTKYNLLPLIILNGSLFYRKETGQIIETDSDVPWNSSLIMKTYGDEIYGQVKRIFNSFVRIAQYDRIIIQISLIILILSKGFSADLDANEPSLNDSNAVYRAQCSYTELLWKYMEATLGYKVAAFIFMELVFNFTTWQNISKRVRLIIRRELASTDTDELLPIMKSLLNI